MIQSDGASTAVVTGAASGIGAAIARRLSQDHSRVIGVDRNECKGIEHIVADLNQPGAAAELAESFAVQNVDTFVSCAGIFEPQDLGTTLDRESYDRVLRVNLTSAVEMMTTLAAAMAERRYGRIVAITSVHAQRAERGALAYDISKAGLEAAVRVLGIEWAHRGVLVNAIAPGFVRTPMSVVDGRNELDDPAFKATYIAARRLPIARPAQPDEVAEVVAFVAGRNNTYVSGTSIVVDGGLITTF
jgi:Dehydrogenases with different specificities (related to short-chain alcohol dehydrogenases)